MTYGSKYMNTLKKCKTCGIEKALDHFYFHKGYKNDRNPHCIPCLTEKRRNDPRVKNIDRNRKRTDEQLLKIREYSKEYRRKNKDLILEKQKKQRQENKENARALRLVSLAIRYGKMVKDPCMVCGGLKVEAHHPDYSNPLGVVWLCVKHHKELHADHRRYYSW